MAYQLVSTNLETYGPTIAGWALVKKFYNLVKEQNAEKNLQLKTLQEFILQGVVPNAKALATDLSLMKSYVVSLSDVDSKEKESVQKSIDHLVEVAMQAKEGLALCA